MKKLIAAFFLCTVSSSAYAMGEQGLENYMFDGLMQEGLPAYAYLLPSPEKNEIVYKIKHSVLLHHCFSDYLPILEKVAHYAKLEVLAQNKNNTKETASYKYKYNHYALLSRIQKKVCWHEERKIVAVLTGKSK